MGKHKMTAIAWEHAADSFWQALQHNLNHWDVCNFECELKEGLSEFVDYWNSLDATAQSVHALQGTGLYHLVQFARDDK